MKTSSTIWAGGSPRLRACGQAARAIAAEGYPVVIVPMPLNLAVFAPDRAARVMAAFPEVERWAIGGHSLGGAMAARFVYRQPSASTVGGAGPGAVGFLPVCQR